MRKTLIFANTFLFFLLSAQNNETLKKEFEQQNRTNNEEFDFYISNQYKTNKTIEYQKEIEELRMNLAGFTPAGKPYFYESEDVDQILNSNSDHLQGGTVIGLTGSFNGENIKYTVFDGGRAYADHFLFNNSTGRVTNKENSNLNYSSHSTAVTGFIGAKNYPYTFTFTNGTTRDVNFRGIAQNATFDNYTFTTTTLPGNTTTSTIYQKIIIAEPKISNHSYGTNFGWSRTTINGTSSWLWKGEYNSGVSSDLQGTYLSNDRNYDQIVYNNPSYIIVKSTGNYYGMGPTGTTMPKYYTDSSNNQIPFAATDILPQNNCALGYDCVNAGSLAKNIIAVGATNIITTNGGRYATATDVLKSSYSSAGPRDDGAIKPDITTTGTSVASASTNEDTIGSNSTTIGSGTSYAAPIVTGIIGLWTQINKQLFNTELNAASAKTLMIHAASEAGNIGPDPWYGWGYINSKKGAELLVGKANNSVLFDIETLNSGVVNKRNVVASGNEPLKVTISWIDPAFTNLPTTTNAAAYYNNRTSRLINDLDLRIIDTATNTVYYPWRLDANSPMAPATKADNTVDNVEQVVIDTPVAGRTYRIEISNKGNLINDTNQSAPQNYSIIATGYSNNQFLVTKDERKFQDKIVIAPTITKDIVKVIKASKGSTFTVYDLSGKRLQNGKINNIETNIDLSIYVKGIYIIEIKTGKESISKKVIKE
ncbi:S8 family peptidase [Chryseobacterium sp. ISL-6]|uniref:S8 family peptidase n=1 Tax=Chryseobacterium sp. ISL-6 TaxID=2819143 RepID=UPI001BE78CA1|nr:S8 family peptidase [Chryseobacterium sp. ISL-6]MBT2620223.1 S8 family peptidase [Chryseobacterium sp. ISL-6]